MYTCSKKYDNLPFAHRQHNHKGHCAMIHGHNWAFIFTFACQTRDANGFVIDFGDLKWLKAWLTDHFDHTLVLNADDPALGYLRHALQFDGNKMAEIKIVPNAGAEGLAGFVFDEVDRLIRAYTADRVFLYSVEVQEDERNSAKWAPTSTLCRHEQ